MKMALRSQSNYNFSEHQIQTTKNLVYISWWCPQIHCTQLTFFPYKLHYLIFLSLLLYLFIINAANTQWS